MSNQRQVAVITGASSGIGKVYADRFAKRGYDLILVARRKERLDALSAELQQKYGVKVDALVADLTKREDLQKVGSTIASNERVSVLVNNAGTAVVGPSAEIPIEQVEFQLDLNTRSVTYLSQAMEVADRIRGLLANERIGPLPEAVTVSFGVAEYISAETAATFLHRVDEALYRAKRSGRNRVEPA